MRHRDFPIERVEQRGELLSYVVEHLSAAQVAMRQVGMRVGADYLTSYISECEEQLERMTEIERIRQIWPEVEAQRESHEVTA